jgi:hypothetical protein
MTTPDMIYSADQQCEAVGSFAAGLLPRETTRHPKRPP